MTIGPVIGADMEVVRGRLHLVLHDEQILGPGTDNGDHVVTHFLETLGDWMYDGHARTTTHTHDGTQFFKVSGFAQGAYDVLEALSNLKRFEKGSRLSHDLVNNCKCPFFRVCVGHGEGNTLSGLIGFQHHKLPRFCFVGNLWCTDLIENHCTVSHFLPFQNFKHL